MPYPHCEGLAHRQRDLLPLTLALLPPAGEAAVNAQASSSASAAQAAALFREIAADQRPGALRVLGYLLSHLFRWLFNSELYVDTGALQRLRALYENGSQQRGCISGGSASSSGQPKACLVYIPAHKSHVDYLLLSYVLFASGLPCPHIAAGANLSLPLVGRLLRACGAFFIRRSSRGAADSQLYKLVLAAYVHALLRAGHSLEFFVEGGRTRDGRVNPPKLGLLRMVVDAAAAGDLGRPVFLVPTAMNYDMLLEERSLAAQLAGAAKKSESLAGLTCTCAAIMAKAVRSRWRRWALGLGAGGYGGRCTVAFGEPIPLQAWLQEHHEALQAGGSTARAAVAELGEVVTAGIRRASVLPTSVLLVAVLFADRHLPGGSAALAPAEQAEGKLANGSVYEVAASSVASRTGAGSITAASIGGESVAATLAGMDWLAAELEQRGAAVVRLPRCAGSGADDDSGAGDLQRRVGVEERRRERLLLHTAGMLAGCCGISRGGGGGWQQARLRLDGGVQATLLQHSRLNQLLPWLATDGLLVAALLGAEARQASSAGVGSLAAAGGAAVSEAEVLDSAAWLRCMLAPEVDTALGPSALRSPQDFEPALCRLLARGVLERPNPGSLRLASSSTESSAQRTALLAAALLAPLLATYCEAARAMAAVLAAAGPGGAASRELCSAAQAHLLALAAAQCSNSSSNSSLGLASSRAGPLVVPSVALMQGVQRSLVAAGALVPAAGTACGLTGSGAAAMAAAQADPAAAQALQGVAGSEAEGSLQTSLDVAASAGSSAGSSGSLDQEYGVVAGAAEAGAGEAGSQAATPSEPAPSLHAAQAGAAGSGGSRRSFERRRQQRQAAAAVMDRGPGASGSGSDCELDPAADSVAANLCRLDSPSPKPAARQVAPAAQPSPEGPAVTVAAAAAAPAPQHAGRWVLGQPERAVQHVADRLEAFICI
ncbi:hypothetical protein ABPG77_005699 [Micractinium sp. CCAP 211/92]